MHNFISALATALHSTQWVRRVAWAHSVTFYTVSQKGDTKLMAVTLSNLNRFLKFYHWLIFWKCNKMTVKDSTTPCICCNTTLWKYLVPEIATFKKWVKHSDMKDSKCHVRFNHLKIVVQEVLPGDDCKHYLINRQRYLYSVHTAQPTEWLIIRICVISVTGNRFCWRSSTCNPPSCLQFY